MTDVEQAMWGSHIPALAACVGMSTGPVLELGVGEFSTPLLHALCGVSGRKLYSVEENREWWEKLRDRFHSKEPWHQFFLTLYDQLTKDWKNETWGTVFIDNSPGGARRAKDFAAFFPVSEFVVVHDYHLDNEEHIAPMLHDKSYMIYVRQFPPTLVAARGGIPARMLDI